MSDIYYIDLQDSIKNCKDIFISLAEKHYIVSGGASTPILEAEKNNAKKEITNLCQSIEHRIELLLYIKDIIKDFDWNKYHRFEHYREESKKTSREDVVYQELQDGKIHIKFKHKESMENYIFINLMTYFSIITSIIDNIAFILKLALNLKIPRNLIPTIVRVQKEMPKNKISDFIYSEVISNDVFTGILLIRRHCEHLDHSQVFKLSEGVRSEAIGSRVSSVPLVRKDLVNIEESSKREVKNFCVFAYNMLYSFLKDFFILVQSTE